MLLALGGLISWWLARSLAGPYRRMEDDMRQRDAVHDQRLKALQAQSHQAEAILQSMVEGVVALDIAGRMLWLNESAQRLIGIAPEQLAGRRLTELVRHQELESLIDEAIAQRHPVSAELRLFSPTEQVVRFQAVPCQREAGEAALVLVAQDVTEVRRLEGLRREFVANVSHELKTPLTSIAGLVETLLNGALEDPANNRRFVSLIEAETGRLTLLIDDLLELSQIESRAVPLRMQPVDLAVLVRQVWGTLERAAAARRIAIEWDLPADAPTVRGDPERLRQVFVNLLDNAIKFNQEGGRIMVRGRRREAAFAIEVEDTGIGIPEPELPRIFERFYRVDKARSRELGGTGLGLAIVKHIVELHQGRIVLRSRLGHGSLFTVVLPLA